MSTSPQTLTFWRHLQADARRADARHADPDVAAGVGQHDTAPPVTAACVWLADDGEFSLVPGPRTAAAVHALRRGSAVGVLIVGEHARVEKNGVACGPGLHAVGHGDRLTIARTSVWVSADVTPVAQAYDPPVHGDDQFCQRTKSRLTPGESIVVCPGTTQRACDSRYKAAAWALGLRCHVCGHDPKAPRWCPPAGADIARLRALLRAGAASEAPGLATQAEGDRHAGR